MMVSVQCTGPVHDAENDTTLKYFEIHYRIFGQNAAKSEETTENGQTREIK
jgi:hypothetical protein